MWCFFCAQFVFQKISTQRIPDLRFILSETIDKFFLLLRNFWMNSSFFSPLFSLKSLLHVFLYALIKSFKVVLKRWNCFSRINLSRGRDVRETTEEQRGLLLSVFFVETATRTLFIAKERNKQTNNDNVDKQRRHSRGWWCKDDDDDDFTLLPVVVKCKRFECVDVVFLLFLLLLESGGGFIFLFILLRCVFWRREKKQTNYDSKDESKKYNRGSRWRRFRRRFRRREEHDDDARRRRRSK